MSQWAMSAISPRVSAWRWGHGGPTLTLELEASSIHNPWTPHSPYFLPSMPLISTCMTATLYIQSYYPAGYGGIGLEPQYKGSRGRRVSSTSVWAAQKNPSSHANAQKNHSYSTYEMAAVSSCTLTSRVSGWRGQRKGRETSRDKQDQVGASENSQ